jgi:uncharacterized protein
MEDGIRMSAVIPPRPDPPLPSRVDEALPRASWRWWEAILVYLLVTIVSTILTLPIFWLILDEDTARFVASAVVAAINVALLVAWLNRFHAGWRDVIGWPQDSWPEVGWGCLCGVVLYPLIVLVVGVVVALLLQAISGKTVEAPEQVPSSMPAYGVVVSIVYATVIAPIHEELFFRGLLHRGIADAYGFAIGAVGSAVAFGLIHYIPGAWQDSVLLMSVMIPMGFALAWIYRWRGNLLAPIVAHATFNIIGIALIYLLD